MRKQHKIQPEERDLLAIWRSNSISIRQIADRLNRSPSTISRELKRNRWKNDYVSIHAQSLTDRRKANAGRRYPLKNRSVYKYVTKKLRCGWSPEQIAGRLKLKHPNNQYWRIHFETIYRYIYDSQNKDKRLWEYLPRKQKKRRKKHGRKSQKVRIPDRVSIHLRPEEVEGRQIIGHWEGDSVVGKNHKSGIHTQVERKTRYLKAELTADLSAGATVKAQSQMFCDLPKSVKKSTTVDNGKEFTNHKQFSLPVFFADPCSSWQRGTNENSNGLIRRYLPKKTDFNKVTQDELNDIIWEINNRPRKCLGFYKPEEKFRKELQILGVAIPIRM